MENINKWIVSCSWIEKINIKKIKFYINSQITNNSNKNPSRTSKF